MSGHPAFRTKSQYDVWPELPDMLYQFLHDLVEIDPMQLPIGIVEYHTAVDAQDLAGSRELFAANGGQFVIVFCLSAMGGGLARSQTDHVDFRAAIVVKPQAAAESSRFVVGMCGYAEDTGHAGILSYEPRAASYEPRATRREQAKAFG